MCRISRYLKVEKWARMRYNVAGVFEPDKHVHNTNYSRIERAVWDKYMIRQLAQKLLAENS